MDTHWCTICDKHTPGGLYCSEECRLADLAGASEPHTREPCPARGLDVWTPTLYRRRSSHPDNQRPRSVLVRTNTEPHPLRPIQRDTRFDPSRITNGTCSSFNVEPSPLDSGGKPPPKMMVPKKSTTIPAETTPTAVTTSTTPLPSHRYQPHSSSRCERFDYYDEKYSALVLRSRPITTLVFGH